VNAGSQRGCNHRETLQAKIEEEILGRTNSITFPICHLFEALEPDVMEIN
jgi:hypothetical protein